MCGLFFISYSPSKFHIKSKGQQSPETDQKLRHPKAPKKAQQQASNRLPKRQKQG